MKLKDIKDKDGKGLLPEKVKLLKTNYLSDDIIHQSNQETGEYNCIISEIGEKELPLCKECERRLSKCSTKKNI